MLSIRGDKMSTRDARLRAQIKYDEAHKDDFKRYSLKFNKKADAEIIFRLETIPNKMEYIRELIRKDIEDDK